MLVQAEKYTSSIILIFVNLFSVYGVLVLGWKMFDILFLYWLESIVIGFWNIFKMLFVSGSNISKKMSKTERMITKFGLIFAKIFAISFFTFHYGLFMIIYMIVIFKEFGHIQDISNGLIESFKQIRLYFLKIWPSLLMLFMSHGASFFINYIGKREYKRADPGAIMFMPYQRALLCILLFL